MKKLPVNCEENTSEWIKVTNHGIGRLGYFANVALVMYLCMYTWSIFICKILKQLRSYQIFEKVTSKL